MNPRGASAVSVKAADLAAEVARAARRPRAARTLFLDLDGTLAPIVASPERAAVPPSTLASLRRLSASGWRVVIVSGRPASEARRMVPLRGIAVYGSHGLEREGAGRRRTTTTTNPAIRKLMALVEPAAMLAREFPGAMLEIKPAGVAFHDRRVSPGRLASWRRKLNEMLGREDLTGIERLEGKRVLELRPAGVNKGSVVRELAGRLAGRRKDASLVAIGDDTTDEDMFSALEDRGLAVRVGSAGKMTRADVRLASPAAVAVFLSDLASTWEGRRRRSGGGAQRK